MTGGKVGVAISDSEAASNDNAGISALEPAAGTTPVVVNIDHTTIAHNNVGINGNGANVTMRIGTSTITNNTTGVKQVNGSTMTSYGTNQISDNPTPGFTMAGRRTVVAVPDPKKSAPDERSSGVFFCTAGL